MLACTMYTVQTLHCTSKYRIESGMGRFPNVMQNETAEKADITIIPKMYGFLFFCFFASLIFEFRGSLSQQIDTSMIFLWSDVLQSMEKSGLVINIRWCELMWTTEHIGAYVCIYFFYSSRRGSVLRYAILNVSPLIAKWKYKKNIGIRMNIKKNLCYQWDVGYNHLKSLIIDSLTSRRSLLPRFGADDDEIGFVFIFFSLIFAVMHIDICCIWSGDFLFQ